MSFESIHNFYEKLVFDAISDSILDNTELADNDFIEDVACVALNNLPAKYVRHDVDLMFYMTANEYEQIDSYVANAVKKSILYVRNHRTTHAPMVKKKRRRTAS